MSALKQYQMTVGYICPCRQNEKFQGHASLEALSLEATAQTEKPQTGKRARFREKENKITEPSRYNLKNKIQMPQRYRN